MVAWFDDADRAFSGLLRDAENLVVLHRRQGVLPGARIEEVSLNRAVVVLAVAAWQTYVELLAKAIVETMRPMAGSPLRPAFDMVVRELEDQRLNTPNSRKTLEVFERLGFDPKPAWTFRINWVLQIGKKSGRKFDTAGTAKELDTWLQVRHRIAHGKSLTGVENIREVTSGLTKKGPTLHRGDAEHCLAFFRELARVTTIAAKTAFAAPIGP